MSTLVRLRAPAWDGPVFPLDEEAGTLLMGGMTLRDLQEAAARDHKLSVADHPASEPLPPGAVIACSADALFSRATIDALLTAARTRQTLVQAAVRHGTALWRACTRMMGPVEGDLPLPLWAGPLEGRKPAVGDDPARAFPEAALVPVCDEDGAVVVRVPPHGRPPHELRIPRARRLGGRVRHWLDVLELSLAALETRRLEAGLVDNDKNLLLGDVDIHPTATVIGSILEDGVRLEPHASVIDSWVGKDVLVADHTVIHSSVIGASCRTLVDTSLRRVVAMPDSTLSNLGISDVVIGRKVFLTTAVATFDQTPGEDVVVEGRDTGRAFLGGAIGARCVLGSRALLKGGVALPPGLLVVARPGEAVLKLDDKGLARANMMAGRKSENV